MKTSMGRKVKVLNILDMLQTLCMREIRRVKKGTC